jgi:carbamoyltransferase
MLLVHKVAKDIQNPPPEGYNNLPLSEKLYFQKSSLPAITHVDYSARIQTIHEDTNPRFYHLAQSFKKLTGVGVLVNTSFNVRGEPIVCTAEDAYRCFMRTEMDILVVEDYIFFKEEQPVFDEKDNWKEEFVLD